MRFLLLFIFICPTCNQLKGQTISLRDFHPKADGKTLDTRIIQQAIDSAARTGHVLYIPPGTYLTGTLHLRSNLTVELGAGAVLQGSPRLDDYENRPDKDKIGDLSNYQFIKAVGCQNLVLRGLGRIDGSGPAFWEPKRTSEYHFWVEKKPRVSPMVEIKDCHNVRLEGFTLSNSPSWTLHLFRSEDVTISGIAIENDLYGPNTDGIDINSCRRVVVQGCRIRAGDDAIVLKTHKNGHDCEYITVTGNVLETNCAALKLGTESHHDFRYITMSGNVVKRASRIIDITACDGGTVEYVNITNTVGETNTGWILGRPIIINANKRTDSSRQSTVRHVLIQGFQCRTDGRVMFGASGGCKIEDVMIADAQIHYAFIDDPSPMAAKTEGDRNFAKGLPELRGARAAVCAQNVDGLTLQNIRVRWPSYPVSEDWLLLKNKQSWGNQLYETHKEDMRTGKMKPDFAPLWVMDVKGLAGDFGKGK